MTIQFKKLISLVKNGGLLRITLLAGVILFFLTAGALTLFIITGRNSTKESRQLESFARSLREYDLLLTEITGSEKDYDRLNRELDRLERRAISVESWLSILKRRRALARIHPPSNENYYKSIGKALEIYPAVQPIAAIASEAMIKNTAINSETEESLRDFLPVFTDSSFNSMRLALHILLGDFNSPKRAVLIPSGIISDGTESVTIDLTILKIVRGDTRGALGDVQTMLHSEFPSDQTLRLAAEYFYDFGDLSRSAELFSLINGEKAMIRQADALFLAGYPESARAIWSILSDSLPPVERSLYNLGVTAYDRDTAVFWFEKLVNLEKSEITGALDTSLQYGLIYYSRLLDQAEAISLLSGTGNLQPSVYPFIDLEIIKRQAQSWELGRQIAEAWLLLDRHEKNEDLYLWAAWLFLYQRNYNELKILLNRTEINDFPGVWVKSFKAIESMFEGELDIAEDTLRLIPPEEADWHIFANLGCIMEFQRSSRRALEQYELAAEKIKSPKTAARLKIRIARCYKAIDRPAEALGALEEAVELDPGNLTAKLELDRLVFSY